jgi:hypothetical protein
VLAYSRPCEEFPIRIESVRIGCLWTPVGDHVDVRQLRLPAVACGGELELELGLRQSRGAETFIGPDRVYLFDEAVDLWVMAFVDVADPLVEREPSRYELAAAAQLAEAVARHAERVRELTGELAHAKRRLAEEAQLRGDAAARHAAELRELERRLTRRQTGRPAPRVAVLVDPLDY